MRDYSLHLVTDDRLDGLLDLISEAIAGGVTVVQLRNKHADKLTLYTIGKNISKLLKSKKIPFIINDHIDLALALNADGIHIGQTDLPYKNTRKILGKNKIIGLSIQTMEHAKKSEKFDVDYFGVGPVFNSMTKTDADAMGLKTLQEIIQQVKKPCIAIGGIEVGNVKSVLLEGAQGIAVVSGICASSSPKLAAHHYVKELTYE
ncbi:MAG: thiamine phosphate synthase [Gammaproteobacteria bacterium]|nr:thiamine phosphate synthase [Gammaproteobacteria bacterium]